MECIDLDELQRQAEAATPGPWIADVRSGISAVYQPPQRNCLALPAAAFVVMKYGKQRENHTWEMRPEDNANMRYIAAANPEVVQALIGAIRKLAKRLAIRENGCDECWADPPGNLECCAEAATMWALSEELS